jgi:mono/diheme cytochrome c family protein
MSMQWKPALTFAILMACAPAAWGDGRRAAEPLASITYERDVRPVFKTHCFQCHGEGDTRKAGLDLRLRRFAVQGGKTGPAIVAGQRDQSLLYQRVSRGEMPPEKKPKLSTAEIAVIGRWIAAGAPTARPEPATIGAEPLITEEDRNFWAFQPIRAVNPPAVKNADRARTPIDAFVLARLEEKGLSYSADADKRTLIRRATFDLTGLPPTLQEIDMFLADSAPDAYDRLLDRLLASPHYGEHWGRHWLDVAGYADSDGVSEDDVQRKYAWHYRDYVIQSINADKPFDQFIVEQLAGDELVKQPYKNLSPADVEKLTATGFLRMAPDGSPAATSDRRTVSNQVIADEIKVVSTSLLGLTVGCAQCHDHRYDPIPQADYYRLRAIFEPAYDLNSWRLPAARVLSLYTDAQRAQAAVIEARAVKLDEARKIWDDKIVDKAFEKELEKVAPELHDALRQAFHAPLLKRNAQQTKLLNQHPNTLVSIGSAINVDKTIAAERQKMLAESAAVRATRPVEQFIETLSEVPGRVPQTFLFYRGDCDSPKQVMAPAELTVLSSPQAAIPETTPALSSSGRRLAYARWLTSGKHPLVGRVLVNRIWMHHFGRGIVASPGDFGALGDRPTHPELLDWLARDFTSNGWRTKRLHKLIMLSTAYRQSSTHRPEQDAVDPDNRLLGRKSLQRLEAEEFRDALLAGSGKLNAKMFGAPVPVMADEVGQFVIGKENLSAGRILSIIPMKGEEFRRSIYIEVRRSRPLSMLATFDEPPMEPNCDARKASTVTPQALMLMNNDFVVGQALEFAQRVRREAGDDPKAEIVRAWQIAFGTEPSVAEVDELVKFLGEQTKHFQDKLGDVKTVKVVAPVKGLGPVKGAKPVQVKPRPEPSLEALATLCQALWSSNPFLYVD